MKGYVYYSEDESIRNRAFIDDLIQEAKNIGIELHLLIDDELPNVNTDFILFRDRNPNKAKSFERLGFRLFNRAEVNKIANDKWRTYQLSLLLGLPTIPTKRVKMVVEVPNYPVVLKTVDGHGGTEVELCRNSLEAEQFLSTYSNREIIAQQYIESGAQDVRVFIIGDEIIGAVKRTGIDSFKSNYTLGGSIESYTLSHTQEIDVRKVVRALKSDYIGIDFLLLPDGSWLLNEIEDPVGARSCTQHMIFQ